ncbi:uncharacterized protein [Macaca nemestrina]|uniref:uncharacterized protein n=2 Tax=Macaca nemestrina TaxID=9545 RepID=UPI0039B86255
MREARAASRVTAVPTVVLETGPLRLGKAGALRGGAWVSGLRGSCLTSPRGRQERLRTDAGSRNAPAGMTKAQAESGGSGASSQPQACPDGVGERLRTDAGSRNAPAGMTKAQAESGGSGASSQPQACPDGVGVSLPESLAPVISTTGPPACPWAALSPEGPSRAEREPAASGGLCACGGCVSVPLLPCDCVCLRLSHPLLSLWPSLSVCVFPSFCRFVCACPCAWVRSDERAPCAQRRLLARRPGSAEPLSSASVPGSCGGLVSGFRRRSTWGP